MAAGRAVVCSDIPGYRTVVTPGRDAIVFPPGDVPALARALSQLVEAPERRGKLAEEGRRRALEFAWPSVVDRIEQVYREAAGRRAAVAPGTASREAGSAARPDDRPGRAGTPGRLLTRVTPAAPAARFRCTVVGPAHLALGRPAQLPRAERARAAAHERLPRPGPVLADAEPARHGVGAAGAAVRAV